MHRHNFEIQNTLFSKSRMLLSWKGANRYKFSTTYSVHVCLMRLKPWVALRIWWCHMHTPYTKYIVEGSTNCRSLLVIFSRSTEKLVNLSLLLRKRPRSCPFQSCIPLFCKLYFPLNFLWFLYIGLNWSCEATVFIHRETLSAIIVHH